MCNSGPNASTNMITFEPHVSVSIIIPSFMDEENGSSEVTHSQI